MNIPVLNQADFYKTNHYRMYPSNCIKIYSNGTPRKSRIPGVNGIIFFGLQYFLIEYLVKQWNENFFRQKEVRAFMSGSNDLGARKSPLEIRTEVVAKYKRMMNYTLGTDSVDTKHIEDLWDLGYLPLEIKALPEGTYCPIGVPCFTITNTVDHAYWLVNYLETIISTSLWQSFTSATIAHEYYKLLSKYAIETTGSNEFVQWQGHDFSMRGMSSLESACMSGAGHLLSFTGTDSIPAIDFLEQYYSADVEKELVGSSVPATEHSVMCVGTKDDEIGTFERLLDLYPKGILSVVSDTWDLWKVCTEYLPTLKEKILARDGKLVIRPDSGDPVDIICGYPTINKLEDSIFSKHNAFIYNGKKYIVDEEAVDDHYRQDGRLGLWEIGYDEFYQEEELKLSDKGLIELLWDTFGGTINEQGYKVLDPHIGAIYGDSITLDRARDICERLKAKGFASINVVLGIGSYTYQYNTRDTFGFAIKATYAEILENLIDETSGEVVSTRIGRELFKDPITDDGTKRSKRGLLQVFNNCSDSDGSHLFFDGRDDIRCMDQRTLQQSGGGVFQTVFLDGTLHNLQTLSQIRERVKGIS